MFKMSEKWCEPRRGEEGRRDVKGVVVGLLRAQRARRRYARLRFRDLIVKSKVKSSNQTFDGQTDLKF